MRLSIGTAAPDFAARPTHGGAIILPAQSDRDAPTPFAGGWSSITPYLRVAPMPQD